MFVFVFYGCTSGIWKFLGQELNLSCSTKLCQSCSNARSFNPPYQAGDQTGPPQRSNLLQSYSSFFFFFFFVFLSFLGPHLRHMEVPRLGVKSELLLSAYTTATATQILNPLSEARDQTCNLMALSHDKNSCSHIFNSLHHSGNSYSI